MSTPPITAAACLQTRISLPLHLSRFLPLLSFPCTCLPTATIFGCSAAISCRSAAIPLRVPCAALQHALEHRAHTEHTPLHETGTDKNTSLHETQTQTKTHLFMRL